MHIYTNDASYGLMLRQREELKSSDLLSPILLLLTSIATGWPLIVLCPPLVWPASWTSTNTV